MVESTQRALFIGLLPLLYLGVSIGMREGIYHNNVSQNWFGNLTGFLTLAAFGSIAAAYLLYKFGEITIRNIMAPFFIGLIVFIAGSIIIFTSPPVRIAFKKNIFLYYFLPVIWSIYNICGLILYFLKITRE